MRNKGKQASCVCECVRVRASASFQADSLDSLAKNHAVELISR